MGSLPIKYMIPFKKKKKKAEGRDLWWTRRMVLKASLVPLRTDGSDSVMFGNMNYIKARS